MIQFTLSSEPIDPLTMSQLLMNSTVGALVTFEGWVRNHNDGKTVLGLEYEVYEVLALSEGNKILEEAQIKFNLSGAVACHRQGYLDIGEIAVWVGTTAAHRGQPLPELVMLSMPSKIVCLSGRKSIIYTKTLSGFFALHTILQENYLIVVYFLLNRITCYQRKKNYKTLGFTLT